MHLDELHARVHVFTFSVLVLLFLFSAGPGRVFPLFFMLGVSWQHLQLQPWQEELSS